jgi:hypothetical protein
MRRSDRKSRAVFQSTGGAAPAALILTLLCMCIATCSPSVYELGECWNGDHVPPNSLVRGKVLILTSKYADDVAYPTGCDGTGIRMRLPRGHELPEVAEDDPFGWLMGGHFFSANIEGTSSNEKDADRPQISVTSVTDIKRTATPPWYQHIR